MNNRLEIILELNETPNSLYMSKDFKVYRVADHVCCPNSPLVSYKIYNTSDLYTQVNPSNEVLQKFKVAYDDMVTGRDIIPYENKDALLSNFVKNKHTPKYDYHSIQNDFKYLNDKDLDEVFMVNDSRFIHNQYKRSNELLAIRLGLK